MYLRTYRPYDVHKLQTYSLETLSEWIEMERRLFWLLYIFAAISGGNLSLGELESVYKQGVFPVLYISHVFIQNLCGVLMACVIFDEIVQ